MQTFPRLNYGFPLTGLGSERRVEVFSFFCSQPLSCFLYGVLIKAMESYAWKYWDADERGGSFAWISYPPAASHILTNALLSGRRNCSVSVGGRQYTVDFSTMSHRNLESHVERPITIAGRLKEGIILSEVLAEVLV